MYTFILALQYQKYRRPAKILLSLDDKTIDHFYLDDSQGLTNALPMVEEKCFDKIDRMRWLQRDDWKQMWMQRPKFFKVYQLNEDELENSIIKISVENKNTDYTNGFMKKNSQLKLHTIALLPTAYLKNNAETYFEILRRVDDGYDKFVRRSLKLDPFLKTDKEISYRRSNPVASWPNVESYMVQKEVGDPELLDKNFWIGGNFEISIPIRQKHKVKYLGSASGRDHGFVNVCNIDSFTIGALKPLLNIYNEDQRSNRT